MSVARILTPWVGTGRGEDPRRPAVLVHHALLRCTDVTATPGGNLPPNPNLCVVQIVCSDAVLAQIEADARYKVIDTDALGRHRDGLPDAAEFGQLRAWLATNGVRAGDLNAAAGAGVGGRTRRQVAQQVAGWLRGRPRA